MGWECVWIRELIFVQWVGIATQADIGIYVQIDSFLFGIGQNQYRALFLRFFFSFWFQYRTSTNLSNPVHSLPPTHTFTHPPSWPATNPSRYIWMWNRHSQSHDILIEWISCADCVEFVGMSCQLSSQSIRVKLESKTLLSTGGILEM